MLIDGALYRLDIRFRMMRVSELAKAQGLIDGDETFEFVGTQGDATKMIGNAVPVRTATALVDAIMADFGAKRNERKGAGAAERAA